MPRLSQRGEQRAPQRNMRIRTAANRYDIDLSLKPAGMDYAWKRANLMGMEDTENLVNSEANGWNPVPAERHPEITGSRHYKNAEIKIGGLVLYERPKEISEEARELDRFAADQQVAAQLQRLKLSGHRAAGRGVKKEVVRMENTVLDDA
jgi:hypothetical protein